jgi:hypothetical protein
MTVTKKTPPKRRPLTKAKKKTVTPRLNVAKVHALAEELAGVRNEVSLLNDKAKELQADILAEMDRAKMKSHAWTDANNQKRSISRIQSTTTIIDEPRLKKRLGAGLWNKITNRTLDKHKLDAYIKSGDIDVKIIAECSEDRTASPFVKVK